jgi:hypothetical protein
MVVWYYLVVSGISLNNDTAARTERGFGLGREFAELGASE